MKERPSADAINFSRMFKILIELTWFLYFFQVRIQPCIHSVIGLWFVMSVESKYRKYNSVHSRPFRFPPDVLYAFIVFVMRATCLFHHPTLYYRLGINSLFTRCLPKSFFFPLFALPRFLYLPDSSNFGLALNTSFCCPPLHTCDVSWTES